MKKLLLIVISLATLNSLYASDKGNGGGGHVCPESVEVYDLYEGRERFGLRIDARTDLSTDETIRTAIEKVMTQHRLLGRLIETAVVRVKEKLDIRNIVIERTLDADNLFHDPGCEYRQIANWDTGIDRILVGKSLWDRLDSFQRGVLIFHEAAYSVYRSHGANTSSAQVTRRFVAEVFSTSRITTQLVSYPYLDGGFEVRSGAAWEPSARSFRYITQNPGCSSAEYVFTLKLLPGFRSASYSFRQSEPLYNTALRQPIYVLGEGVSFRGRLSQANPEITFTATAPHIRFEVSSPSPGLFSTASHQGERSTELTITKRGCDAPYRIGINSDQTIIFWQ